MLGGSGEGTMFTVPAPDPGRSPSFSSNEEFALRLGRI
jgi:hypothetical protein